MLDGSMLDASVGSCTADRIATCTAAGEFCDPATGGCVANCTNAICMALSATTPICNASGTACVGCTGDIQCGASGLCESGACVECDGDDDGFPSDEGRCSEVRPLLPRDCRNDDPSIYPGALPICNNTIDESCAGPEGIAGGLANEFGRYAPVSVPFPIGTDRPSRLRIFMLEPGRALIFLVAGNAGRTVSIAFANLDEGTIESNETLEDILGSSGFPLVRSDAIRLPNGNPLIAMFSSSGANAQVIRAEYDVASGEWASSTTNHPLDGAFLTGFSQTGDAALVRRADGNEYVVTAGTTAAEPDEPRVFAFGIDMASVLSVAPPGTITSPRPWIESTGDAAVFASPTGEVRFWTGEAGGGDQSRVARTLTAPVGGGAFVPVRNGSEFNRIAFLVPTVSTLEAFTLGCTTSDPLHQCTTLAPGTDSPNSYPLNNVAQPSIAAVRLSSTALVAAVTRMDPGGPRIGFYVVETEPLSLSLLELPATVPIDGTPLDVAVDALLTPDVDESGTMEFASVYLEEQGAARRVLLVGGRGCIGYPSF